MFMEYVGSPHLSATLYNISDEPPQLSKIAVYGTSETVTCNKGIIMSTYIMVMISESAIISNQNITVYLNELNGAS